MGSRARAPRHFRWICDYEHESPIPTARQPRVKSPLAQLFFILSYPAKLLFLKIFKGRDKPIYRNVGNLVACDDVSCALGRSKIYEWDGQGPGGYCGLAIGLVDARGRVRRS